jgi:hypothetical protein
MRRIILRRYQATDTADPNVAPSSFDRPPRNVRDSLDAWYTLSREPSGKSPSFADACQTS